MVDDEPNVLSGYRRTLEPFFQVHVSANASDGLRVLESQGPFALVIADYCMPETDGNDFLLQAKEIAPDTVRIMLTGKGNLDVAMTAVNQGSIFRFLTKPCSATVLVESVVVGVNQYRSRQEEASVLALSSTGISSCSGESTELAEPTTSDQQSTRPGSGEDSLQGQKALYQGLACWQREDFREAYGCLLQAKEIFSEIRASSELARTYIYLAGLGLVMLEAEDVTEAEVEQWVCEGLEVIKEHELVSILLTEGTCALPVLKWALKHGVGTDFLPEVLTKLGEGQGEEYLRISALGPLNIHHQGRLLMERDWRSPKVKRLFFFLLSHRDRKTEREVLLETFWPEKEPEAAANNFSSILYYLRKALGPDTIRYEKGLCWLNTSGIWCDVFVFEQSVKAGMESLTAGHHQRAKQWLHNAIALYSGDYLEEYLYDDWLEMERQRLQSLYIDALIKAAKLWAKEANYQEAIALLKKVPLKDFYASQVVALLVEYLILSGKTSEAKRIYRYYQELYWEETGMELLDDQRVRGHLR